MGWKRSDFMKYRRLGLDELQQLEQDFINFLAANSVTSDDWEKLKQESPEKVEQLLDIFSDMVFDKTLEKVQYLEQKAARELRTFHCLPEHMIMLGLRIQGQTQLDFRQQQSPQEMMQQLQASRAQLQLFRGEKAYRQDRKLEIFHLMEQGALISKDGQLFKTLEQLKKA